MEYGSGSGGVWNRAMRVEVCEIWLYVRILICLRSNFHVCALNSTSHSLWST